MSRFQLREIRVDNYRCFDELTLPLEDDATILFAENGGGKTALLTAQGGFVLHGFLNPPNEITAGLDILPAL